MLANKFSDSAVMKMIEGLVKDGFSQSKFLPENWRVRWLSKGYNMKSDVSWIRLSRYLSDGKPSFLNPAFESLKSVKKVLDNKKKNLIILIIKLTIIIIFIRCWST